MSITPIETTPTNIAVVYEFKSNLSNRHAEGLVVMQSRLIGAVAGFLEEEGYKQVDNPRDSDKILIVTDQFIRWEDRYRKLSWAPPTVFSLRTMCRARGKTVILFFNSENGYRAIDADQLTREISDWRRNRP